MSHRRLFGFVLIIVAFLFAVGLSVDRPAAASPDGLLLPFSQRIRLAPEDTEVTDFFGSTVVLKDNLLAISAPFHNGHRGAVYLFDRDHGGSDYWGQTNKLEASITSTELRFGTSIVLDQGTMAVGSSRNGFDTSQSGRIFILERDQGGLGNWGEVTDFLSPGNSIHDYFAYYDPALSGDTLVVSAPRENPGGEVYIFERDAGGTDNWGLIKTLVPVDLLGGDFFGQSIALDGDWLFISSGTTSEEFYTGAGRVYIFNRDLGGPDNWGHFKTLFASDGFVQDRFGLSISLSGDTLAVGAWSFNVPHTGAVYIFERDAGGPDNWGETNKILASDAEVGSEFGSSISLDADTLVVGAPEDDGQGAVYVYSRGTESPGAWGEESKLRGSSTVDGNRLGNAVALDGDGFAVGAPYETGTAENSGVAYVFQRGAQYLSKDAYIPLVNNCNFLYFDDFSDPNSGWPVVDTGSTLFEYRNGEYRTLLRNANGFAGAVPGVTFGRYQVDVTVRNVTNKPGTYGLLFARHSNWTSFYTFEIGSAKQWELWKFHNGWFLLDFGTSSALNSGTASNSISILRDSLNGRTEAYANGTLISQVTDNSLAGVLSLGIWVTGGSQENLDIRFDDYSVLPLGCGYPADWLDNIGAMPDSNQGKVDPAWLLEGLPTRDR